MSYSFLYDRNIKIQEVNIMTDMKMCQSCAMPMTEDAQFGTNKDGTKNEDYCSYCYADGAFVGGDSTMEEVIETCVKPCLDYGVYPDADTARAAMMVSFPKLKRWAK